MLQPTTEPTFRAWAVYADYDGNAPDTAPITWLAEEEDAKTVAGWLNVSRNVTKIVEFDGKRYHVQNNRCFVIGFEYAKVWRFQEVVSYRPGLHETIAEALASGDFADELADGEEPEAEG